MCKDQSRSVDLCDDIGHRERLSRACDTKERLAQGERIREILKQPQYNPVPVEFQVIIIYAATKKYLLQIATEQVTRFESELFEFIKTKYPEVPEKIRTNKKSDEETEPILKKAIEEAIANFR